MFPFPFYRYPEDLGDGRAVRDAIQGWIEGRLVTGALMGIEGPRYSTLMAASISGTEQTLPESSRTYCGATMFRKPRFPASLKSFGPFGLF